MYPRRSPFVPLGGEYEMKSLNSLWKRPNLSNVIRKHHFKDLAKNGCSKCVNSTSVGALIGAPNRLAGSHVT